MAGEREQQGRRGGGERRPERIVGDARRRCDAVGHCRDLGRRGTAPPRERAARDREDDEPARPADCLHARRQPRLEDERIGDEREHRAQVGKRVQPVGHRAVLGARVPGLHERARGREQEVGQADARGEQAEDPEAGIRLPGRLPARVGQDRQRGDPGREQREMDERLRARLERPDGPVRVRVAADEQQLEEQHARRPHGRRPAEPRQDHLGDDRLHLEQQERREEDGYRVEHASSDGQGALGVVARGELRT